MRHTIMGMVSCALALSLGLVRLMPRKDVKYTATRAIAMDSVTGKYRKPNGAEIKELVAELKALTRQPVATAMTSTAHNTGGITAKLGQGVRRGQCWRGRRPTAALKPVASLRSRKAPSSSGSSPT